MKLTENHLAIIAVIGFILLATFGGFGFLGSISGFCESVEAPTKDKMIKDISQWNYRLDSSTINDNKIFWKTSEVTVDFMAEGCNNRIIALNEMAKQQSQPAVELIRGPTTVYEFMEFVDPTQGLIDFWGWCDKSDTLFVRTNDKNLMELYFENFFVCEECEFGEQEETTCADGTKLITKVCGEDAKWKVKSTCPLAVDAKTGGFLGDASALVKCDFEGEYYDESLRKCVGSCTVDEQCPSIKDPCGSNKMIARTCDTSSFSCKSAGLTCSPDDINQKKAQTILPSFDRFSTSLKIALIGMFMIIFAGMWFIIKIRGKK